MATSIISDISFKDLCHLCDKISVSSRDKKGEYLKKYINSFREYAKKKKGEDPTVDDSFFPVLRLLLPQLDRERGAYGVKEHNLAKIYIRILGLPKEGQDALKLLNFRAPKTAGNLAGDFGEVAFYILKNRCPAEGSLNVQQVNDHLDNIALKHADHDPRGVDGELTAMLTKMSATEQKWLIRMLLKDMKLGLGQGGIFYAYHPDAHELYDVSNDLLKICQMLKDPTVRLHEVEVSLFSPFRPMLAERCNVKVVEESMKKSNYYFVETKHDGERFQVHMKDGVFKYFSRRAFEFTNSYSTTLTPHIKMLLNKNVKSCILDGEMMGWNQNSKCFKFKGTNFDVKTLKETGIIRPCFCVFDILLYNDQVLTNKPLVERHKYLENMFKPHEGVLMFTERKKVTNREEVINELNEAIDNRLEGIVLKDPTSVYKPNNRKGGWYKIKPEYTDGLMDHIDLLIMGGYFGEGRRKGHISHFLVGAAVPPKREGGEPNEFHSFTRVGSGYTMDELSDLLKKLSPHWQQVKSGQCPSGLIWTKEKPDVWIAPQNSYILEVKATEMVPSNAFKVDYTLRFPRVETIRYDKKWSDCVTLSDLENLKKEASGKLYSRHIDANETTEKSPRKRQRVTAKATRILDEQFRRADISDINAVSNLLESKEFCVLTGWKELSKQDVEIKIAKHGGTIVQNPGANTYCALAEESTLRVRNIQASRKCTVAKLEWLLHCITSKQMLSWTPADLLYATADVERKLSMQYDEFGDSYTQPATEESLRYAFEQVNRKGCAVKLTEGMIADLEIDLFSGPSPFSMFRLCRAYIDKFEKLNDSSSKMCNFLDIVELDFNFYGGQICPQIDESTTHVIIYSESLDRLQEIKDLNRRRLKKFHIVSEQWVCDTVKQRQRQNENDYFL